MMTQNKKKRKYLYGPGLLESIRNKRINKRIASATDTRREVDNGFSDEMAVITNAAVKWR